jgi:protein-L-isoaspartate(D-aspartate) O-methyltransferase
VVTPADANAARAERMKMVREQIESRGVRDERVLAALREIPRERFFPPHDDADPFGDHAAPIGHGQTISQPYIVALMSEQLRVAPTHRVLEVGTGSGYQTAVLSRLAGEVFTVERVKPLLDAAFHRLGEMRLTNVHYRHGDGCAGWPERAPFDRILIAAAAEAVPEQLLRAQLSPDGGVAVLPAGSARSQTLYRIERFGDDLRTTDLGAVVFVPLVSGATKTS